jgi:hypothetical protein
MDEWTEEQWREAERRQPGKTYIDPKMRPWHESSSGRMAIACLVLAALAFVGLVLTWGP